jgi:shikimate kinase
MNNIVLIGMPGAGKSTVGVVLAKTLGMNFIDTDLLIQERHNTLLQNMINNEGIDSFIRKEEESILSLECNNSVIATGGSVVYSHISMEHLKKLGKIIYLKLSFEEIAARINNIKTRGIVIEKGQQLSDVFDLRTPLYEKYCDITINCSGLGMEDIIENIKKEIH